MNSYFIASLVSILITGLLWIQGDLLKEAPPKGSTNEEIGFQTEETTLETEKLISNLDFPWEILWKNDNLWITQTTGAIIRYNPKFNESKTLINLPAAVNPDHGNPAAIGLFGLALHPDFPDVPWVYVMYNYEFVSIDDVSTRISRLEYNMEKDTLENEHIFIDAFEGWDKHSGGRMIITQDRKLLVTTGDEFQRSFAQRLDKLNGKTLRFNLDGTVPEDNPFRNQLASPFSYIYTLGHRNPQGLVQTSLGYLYSSEHGPNSDDEINLLKVGENYGWPYVKGFCDDNYPANWNDNLSEGGESELAPYFGTTNHRSDLYPGGYENESDYCAALELTEPAHSFLNERVAPSGLDYYASDTIPEWKNALLLATLREKDIRLCKLTEDQTSIESVSVLFNESFDRVRDLAVTPFGDVYVISSERENNDSNSLYRISKSFDNYRTAVNLNVTYDTANEGLSLDWEGHVDHLSYFIVTRKSVDMNEKYDTLDFDETTFLDLDITIGTDYTYQVRTMRLGQEVGISEEVSFTEIDYPVALVSPTSLMLSWNEAEGGISIEWEAEVDKFTTFVIYREDESDDGEIAELGFESRNFIDNEVLFGTPYSYFIETLRDGQQIGITESVDFRVDDYPIVMTLPSSLTLAWDEAGEGISIEWQAEVDELTSFIVNRSDESESIPLDTLNSASLSYLDQSIIFQQPYGYIIKSLRNDKIIGKSDSVIFSSDEYPVAPLRVVGKESRSVDIFGAATQGDWEMITVTFINLSGKKIMNERSFTWSDWVLFRDHIRVKGLLVWLAVLEDEQSRRMISGKHVFR